MTSTRNRFFEDQYRSRRIMLISLIALVGAVFVYFLANWSEKKALIQAEEKAQSVLAYQSSNLISHLNKFSLIAALVSRRPDVVNMFRQRDSERLFDDGSELSSMTTGLSGAKDIWFVDKQGVIFSSSSPTLIGRNVKYESYFEAAFQGRLGRSSTVDVTGTRYYVFASPIFVDQKIEGLVAVRVDLEVVEYVWALLSDPVVATESNGRILLSNIEQWRLEYFPDLIKKRDVFSYASATDLKNLPALSFSTSRVENFKTNTQFFNDESTYYDRTNQRANIVELNTVLHDKKSANYLEVTTIVPLLQWQIHVFIDLSPVKQQRWLTVVISTLLVVLIILVVWVLFERRRRSIERVRDQKAFSLRLERQVRDRTHELTATNMMLELEVHERSLAEKALRESQQDLVQAAKLAGIGQMSAALAHEYNQPLAAIRSYSDNALQLLALEKTEAVHDNLSRITTLTERMADLTKTLRSFAHKSDTRLESVSLSAIVDEMIILLSPLAKKQGVELIIHAPAQELLVSAGHLRLSQVVINLVTNAMDAVKGRVDQRVEVSWYIENGQAIIAVKDSGEGVPEALKEKIFTPFFTTKGVGVGLGLGLFIVYNMVKEFQGSIEVQREADYGGVFYITLPLADDGDKDLVF